jgi:hypothetical protein
MGTKSVTILFTAFLLALVSCSSVLTEADIIGTWNCTDYLLEPERISPDLYILEREYALSKVYHFDEDHQFTLESSMSEVFRGIWHYDATKNELRLDVDGEEQVFTLRVATANYLEMAKSSGGLGKEITTLEK